MNMHEQQQPHQALNISDALVAPLDALNRTQLPLVGGKAAQLGELIRAGFTVPVAAPGRRTGVGRFISLRRQ